MKVIEALIEEGDGRNLRACIERNPRIINETIGGVPAVHLALRKKQERWGKLCIKSGIAVVTAVVVAAAVVAAVVAAAFVAAAFVAAVVALATVIVVAVVGGNKKVKHQ